MASATTVSEFAADVRAGLGGSGLKTLPPKWFYDDVGSALFEAITALPEYGLTRAEAALLDRHSDEMAGLLDGGRWRVAELGSGSGRKTRLVLEALARRAGTMLDYHPIDVSAAALDGCARVMEGVARVRAEEAEYEDGLRRVARARRDGEPLLVLFLGSNLGNYEPERGRELLNAVRAQMAPGDALVLGVDLVKDEARLLAAYDDAAGVTAAFNRNVVARIDRELDGELDAREFEHQARWDAHERRVEMHLRSVRTRRPRIGQLGMTVEFQDGETIWTESSYKYDAGGMEAMAERAGFEAARMWLEREWGFAENLWLAR
jgi:L-histidine N-alpha-methyltransferase